MGAGTGVVKPRNDSRRCVKGADGETCRDGLHDERSKDEMTGGNYTRRDAMEGSGCLSRA